jgi:hypothetical protein
MHGADTNPKTDSRSRPRPFYIYVHIYARGGAYVRICGCIHDHVDALEAIPMRVLAESLVKPMSVGDSSGRTPFRPDARVCFDGGDPTSRCRSRDRLTCRPDSHLDARDPGPCADSRSGAGVGTDPGSHPSPDAGPSSGSDTDLDTDHRQIDVQIHDGAQVHI